MALRGGPAAERISGDGSGGFSLRKDDSTALGILYSHREFVRGGARTRATWVFAQSGGVWSQQQFQQLGEVRRHAAGLSRLVAERRIVSF